MCDYSLMHYANRLAREGEELIVHRFPSGSLGLVSPADLNRSAQDRSREPQSFWASLKDFFAATEKCAIPAVCVPPGARLLLHSIAGPLRREYGLQAEEEVTFEQLTALQNTHRDAIVFQNGRALTLQQLPEGQRVAVLALGPSPTDHAGMVSPVPVQTIT
jgi:hypothetical protein